MMSVPQKALLPFCLLSAGLLWLGFPGGGELWPVLFISLVPVLFTVTLGSAKKRFGYGLAVGILHFLLQLYWIVFVLGRYGGLPWYFAYPATVLLALYMSFYFAFFTTVAGAVWQRWGAIAFLWLAPCLWVGIDWLRGILFTGFPWMDIGYGLWKSPYIVQAADLFGHHFLTFLIVLANSAIFLAIQHGKNRKVAVQLIAVALVFVAVTFYGNLRSNQLEKNLAASDTMVFGVVQGNIDQSRKWVPEEQQRTMDTYLVQTRELLSRPDPPKLVVWPETALPFYPTRNPLFHALPRLAFAGNISLLTGSPWFEIEDAEKQIVNFFNAAMLIFPDGEQPSLYFKSHLVPFGEYVPLKKLLFFLAPLVEAVGDFSPGKVEKPLLSGKARCGILICFESIFPDITRKWVDAGANVLVNLTNDAWYGRSSAPVHSMAMSVLRSIESRRSLVRAANTGISGFVDPLGRVLKSSPIFVDWAESMPVKLVEEISFYSRYGYFFGPLCFLLTVIAGGVCIRRRGL